MDLVARAPELIAALFDDAGAAVLREGQLGATWQEALRHVPPELLAVQGGEPGLRQLTILRDFWSRRNDLLPALAATRGLLRLAMERHGPDHPETLVEIGALGALAQRAGKVEEGAQLLERAYQGLQSRAGGKDVRVAVVGANLALHHVRTGQIARAADVLERAYRIRKRVAPESVAMVAAQLGELKAKLGHELEAADLHEEAWKLMRAQAGPLHPRTIARARAFGALLNAIGHHGRAVAPLRDAFTFARTQGDAEMTAACGFELGLALDAVGQKEEGLRLVEDAIRWTRMTSDALDAPHPSLAQQLTKFAAMQLQRGRPAEAEGLMLEALDAERRLHGEDSAEVAARYAALGYFLAKQGRVAEAMGWLDPAASLMRSAAGDEDPRTRMIVEHQVQLLVEQAQAAITKRDRELARSMLRRAWTLAVPVLGHGDRRVARVRELASGLGLPL